MDAIKAIMERRSVRAFKEEKIEKEDLMTILSAGLSGPSACNRRPWEMIVVDDREILSSLLKGKLEAKPLLSAPVAIVVAANTEKAIRRAPLYWTCDASAATENMIIAAQSLSLGSLWLGVWPQEDKISLVRAALSLPENIVPYSILALGKSGDQGEPMWKKVGVEEEKIHWGKW